MGQRSTVWPLVYINLDRDVQRRERMEALLSELPFPHTRLPGVLWSALSPQEQARLYSPSLNARQFFRPLVDGEKGCYASHLRACEHLLASDWPAIVVLEDDVALADRFCEIITALQNLGNEGWDLIKLYSRPDERPRARQALTGDWDWIIYQRVPSMSNGYVLSRAGARKLLNRRIPFARPVDVDVRYWWECDLRVYGVLPSIVTMAPSSEDSSIWVGGRPHRRWGERIRRWSLQADYSLRNAWYGARQSFPVS
jgi:glycosyl transferase family 25